MSAQQRALVAVNETTVGELVSPGRPEPSVFLYKAGTAATEAVSVTMPVQEGLYSHPSLHPIFAQNLPEGYLGDILRKTVAKLFGTGDLALLTTLGRYQVGRVAVMNPTLFTQETASVQGESLNTLLTSSNTGLFEELIEKYALHSGISGVQPKVIVPALTSERASLKTEGFIVKSWGNDYPELAANEYFCMGLAKAVGLPVPDFDLSRDGRLFVIKRFDRNSNGRWLGFEDGCVLQGRAPDEKYSGSYEQLAKTLSTFISPEHRVKGMRNLFLSLLVSWAVRNGDAHLKNFGILYDQPFGSRRLAPTYDIVSTVPYLSRDVPALTLAGRKVWWSLKYLMTFGRVSCGLTLVDIRAMLHSTRKGLLMQRQLIQHYQQAHPNFAEVGTAMAQTFLETAGLIDQYLTGDRSG